MSQIIIKDGAGNLLRTINKKDLEPKVITARGTLNPRYGLSPYKNWGNRFRTEFGKVR